MARGIAIGLLVLNGCRSGDSGPIGPVPEAPLLARLWPNDNGNSWTFEYRSYSTADAMIEALDGPVRAIVRVAKPSM